MLSLLTQFPLFSGLQMPWQGRKWCRLIDTNLAPPKDFTKDGNNGVDATYGVAGYSSIVLITKPL